MFGLFAKKATTDSSSVNLDHQPVVVKSTMGNVDITDTSPKTIQMLKANSFIDGNYLLEPGTPQHDLFVAKTMLKVQFPNLGPTQLDALAKRAVTGEPTEEALQQRNAIARNAAIKSAVGTKEMATAATA